MFVASKFNPEADSSDA